MPLGLQHHYGMKWWIQHHMRNDPNLELPGGGGWGLRRRKLKSIKIHILSLL